jgi:hypothetical protein
MSATTASMSQTCSVSPAALAGATRSGLCIRQQCIRQQLSWSAQSATLWAWLSACCETPLVGRVQRRLPMRMVGRMVGFGRPTWLVLILAASGVPKTGSWRRPLHSPL